MTGRGQLVGRDRELGVLRGALTAALSTRPQLVLCGGEPGIGKTRLAEELDSMATGAGVHVAWAHGFADAPPFWPWRQLLRAMNEVAPLGPMADRQHLHGELSLIAPEIFGADAQPEGAPSPAQRFAHFDAVARLIHHVAADTALALILDDAHAADQGSLILLQHVARTLTDERLLLFVTYRDTESSTMMLDLSRTPHATSLTLAGLDVAGVGAQLAEILGRPPRDTQVRDVHALTAGNPFFVAQTALTLRDSRDARPRVAPTVIEAVAQRMRGLSPLCQKLLTAGGILGPEFRVESAAAMIDESPDGCWDAVDEAVRARFLEPDEPAAVYRFAHALVREAVEAALPSAERIGMHRRAITVIEETHAGNLAPHLFQLAHHWAVAGAGGDKRTAADWISRAAAEATSRSAFEESADLYRLALNIGGSSLSTAQRCQLLLGIAAAAHGAADLRGRLEACVQAAQLARDLGRADLLAEAALILEATLEPVESNLAARRLCEEALDAVTERDVAVRARLTARLAQVCVYLGDTEAAQSISEQALQLAEQSGDPVALDDALHGRQVARDGPDGVAEREALAARLLQLARDTRVASRELWARLWLVDAHFERGDLAAAARELELLHPLADDVGGPWPRWAVLRGLSVLAQALARFDQSRQLADDALVVIARTGDPVAPIPFAAILQTAGHHTGQDQRSLAASGIGDAPVDASPFLIAGTTPVVATALLLFEAGRAAEAEALYRVLGPPENWRPHAHGTLAAFVMGLRVAVGIDAKNDVASLCALLEPFRGLHAASGAGAVAYWGPVELALGIGARHLSEFDRAVRDLQDAMRACAISGAEGFRVEAEVELAETLAQQGTARDRDRAATLASDALRQATRLGMTPFSERARTLLHDLEGGHPSSTLTRREREVAVLMAQGLTNAQIAARLFLSPRTAQSHVQHVLGKLEMDNRAQVAAWVTAQKLRAASQ